MWVLVEGNKIKLVEFVDILILLDVELIDGGGGVLMLGLIDVYWYVIMVCLLMMIVMMVDFNYI